MKKLFNLYFVLGIIFSILFVLLIVLLKFDRAIITENGKEVGLKTINNIITYEEKANYESLSKVLFIIAFAIIGVFLLIGLYELLKKRNLFKVNPIVLAFGVSIVILVGFWLLFDKVLIINYRPIGELEGSFPSTHVLLITFTSLSFHKYICNIKPDSKFYKYSTLIIAIFLIVIMAFSRVYAGKHYITDVVGGIILGSAIYFLTFGVLNYINSFKSKKKKKINE